MLRISSKLSLVVVAITIILLFGMMSSAKGDTIYITPGTQWGFFVDGVLAPADALAMELLLGLSAGTLTELYKSDFVAGVGGIGFDSGPFALSYQTTFGPPGAEPTDATIIYLDGSSFITHSPLYLLVKDGAHGNYIFDLQNLTNITGDPDPSLPYSWNGIDTIVLVGFWAGIPGSISHVSIFGGQATTVPEPSTLLLLGAGLLGLGLVARRRKK